MDDNTNDTSLQKSHKNESSLSKKQKNDKLLSSKNDSATISNLLPTSQKSCILMDHNEIIKVESAKDMLQKLCCDGLFDNECFKVISIFGNTGDGKSYTLNNTFFHSQGEVFQTSNSADPCTMGIWAAIDPVNKLLLLDTEGCLGSTCNKQRRYCALLKVIALSDVIIYRSRAERLHTDMFDFLCDANVACKDYMGPALIELNQKLAKSVIESVGSNNNDEKKFTKPQKLLARDLSPSVLVFQTTENVEAINGEKWKEECEKYLPTEIVPTFDSPQHQKHQRQSPHEHQKMQACVFGAVEYISGKNNSAPTLYHVTLKEHLLKMLQSQVNRQPRSLAIFLAHLTELNKRFNGTLLSSKIAPPPSFPVQYFTCIEACEVCHVRCELSMAHKGTHKVSGRECIAKEKFDNKIYFCKRCKEREGRQVKVMWQTACSDASLLGGTFSYLWSGAVLECPNCGELARSRQRWLSGSGQEEHFERRYVNVVFDHIFPGDKGARSDTAQTMQRVVDTVHCCVVKPISAASKSATQWTSEKVRPHYWKEDHLIQCCCSCQQVFQEEETKHHCRSCGDGVCDSCSDYMEVPGWEGYCRVCKICFDKRDHNPQQELLQCELESGGDFSKRMTVDVASNALNAASSVLRLPTTLLKDMARPLYWEPDHLIVQCHACGRSFNPSLPIHHCRCCGKGVCDSCSRHRIPIPHRGYNDPKRVCNACVSEGLVDIYTGLGE